MIMNEGMKKQIKDKAVCEFDALIGAYLDVMNKRALKGEYTQENIKKDWNDTVSEAEWIIKDIAQAVIDATEVQVFDEPVNERNNNEEENTNKEEVTNQYSNYNDNNYDNDYDNNYEVDDEDKFIRY